MEIVRPNTENSRCIYCGYKIGLKMKCKCGVIDPPVKDKEISK